ncbi:MAG: MFS transporter [Bacteroidetes bacterium HGW-Bacteroidetes-17]|jgi:EmrB/QacA subfamily drug resistance transporter|nr:MAG: MFS transporter [Bacteroidetes bacterium HGW-Bacteroidetes-17]
MKDSNPHLNKHVLLAVTMASNFLNPLMGAAVNVALPKIGEEFSMSAVGLSWVSMSFLLATTIFLVPFGKISDSWGRRKMFFYGNISFAISSLFCALSASSEMLIIGRFLQGITAAGIFATSMAIVISAFEPHERGKMIGLNVMAVYIGLSIAPVLGGVLTSLWGWRSLFFINTGAVLLIIVAIITKIKAEWAVPNKAKFDITGTMIYMVSVSGLMYGFSHLPKTEAIIFTLLGIAGVIIFINYELKQSNPVLEIQLFFKNKLFAFSNLSAFINYAATFAITFVFSLYLQYVKGLSPKDAGLILIAQPVVMAFVASFSGKLSDTKDPRILASIGMGVSAAGLLMLVFISKETPYSYIIVALMILGFGFGMFSSPNTNSVMSSVENRFLGIASATVSTMRTTGMMFSMAIAALSIHLFLGDDKINADNLDLFILSVKAVIITFVLLCIIGIFTSLVGRRK